MRRDRRLDHLDDAIAARRTGVVDVSVAGHHRQAIHAEVIADLDRVRDRVLRHIKVQRVGLECHIEVVVYASPSLRRARQVGRVVRSRVAALVVDDLVTVRSPVRERLHINVGVVEGIAESPVLVEQHVADDPRGILRVEAIEGWEARRGAVPHRHLTPLHHGGDIRDVAVDLACGASLDGQQRCARILERLEVQQTQRLPPLLIRKARARRVLELTQYLDLVAAALHGRCAHAGFDKGHTESRRNAYTLVGVVGQRVAVARRVGRALLVEDDWV